MLNYTDFKTYKYDVNLNYPKKKPMTGEITRISTEKELNKIFGYVESTVEAPSANELKVLVFTYYYKWKTELFRGIATGKWWSEELKNVCWSL